MTHWHELVFRPEWAEVYCGFTLQVNAFSRLMGGFIRYFQY